MKYAFEKGKKYIYRAKDLAVAAPGWRYNNAICVVKSYDGGNKVFVEFEDENTMWVAPHRLDFLYQTIEPNLYRLIDGIINIHCK